jgi:preprotein translocase subunit SecA
VHVLTSSEPYAVAMAARLSNDLRPLGLTVSAVTAGQGLRDRIETYRSDIVCGTLRDVAQDYLRDRIRLTRSRSKLGSLAERLGGESAGEAGVLRGLHSALIADADVVMLDDALVPVAIAADADTSHERLLYEQALALAQTLQAPLDFTVNDGAVVLSALGASLLERRAHGLGGLWSATRRRETIVASALHVLHGWTDGRDYRVREGRLEWPSSEQKLEGDAAEEQALRRKLAEIKEGCDLTAKRDVVARLPVTRFLRRYRHLGGACADVRGISGELQSLYPVRVRALWSAAASAACVYRVCLDVETKVRVLLDVVRKGQGEGRAIVIAARSSEVADALLANLKAAGLEVELLHAGLEAAAVEGTLCILDRACGIVLALHPAARLFRRERATAIPVDLVIVELHEGPHAAAHLVHAFGADTCTALLSFDDKALDLGAIIEQSARLLAGSKKTLNPTASRAIAMLAQRRLDAERAIQRQEGLSREQYLADLLAFSGRRE